MSDPVLVVPEQFPLDPRTDQSIGVHTDQSGVVGAGSNTYHDHPSRGSDAQPLGVVVGQSPEPPIRLASESSKHHSAVQDLTIGVGEVDGFDLDAMIRQVLKETAHPDNSTLADLVYERIPPEHRDAVLRGILRVYVSNRVTWHRSSVFTGRRPGYQPEQQPAQAQPGERVTNKGKGRGKPAAGQFGSHHVAWVHRYWERLMSARLSVGPAKDEAKLFGDCDRDDLAYARDLRLRIAEANTANAAKLDAVSELLVKHDAVRVRDLPEAVVVELFQGDGADGGDLL